ncbi:MAG: HEAT repeat domain-containing protein [Pirellulales bacterium]
MRATKRNLFALAVGACLLTLSGCAATAESAGGLLAKMTGKKSPEQVLNIKTPDDRVKELRELAKTAGDKSPEEQNRIVAELSEEIQHEKEPVMRRHILRTLGEYHTPLSSAIARAGLKDTDLEVRRVACESLGRQGGAEAVRDLAQAASSDTEIDVRIAAVKALGATQDKAAVPYLGEALADPDPAVQYRAIESLRLVSGRDFGENVQAWRDFAQTGKSDAPEASFAERWRRALF